MSSSCSSAVIVGAPVKGLYITAVQDAEKTQFDKDTGKPYKVPVKQLIGTFGNKKLPPVEFTTDRLPSLFQLAGVWLRAAAPEWREKAHQDFDFLKEEGLQIHLPSSEGFSNADYVAQHGIVGISLCSGSSDYNDSCSLDAIRNAAEKVKKALVKFGYAGEIKVYSQVTK